MIIQKSWTELLGQPQKYDQIMDNDIVRPTNYFFIGEFVKFLSICKSLSQNGLKMKEWNI
jgi:hypothetical protein